MQIPSDKQLLDQIESFLARTDMKPTRFGRNAIGEASLVKTLREGRSLTLKTAQRIVDYMGQHDAANTPEGCSASATKIGGIIREPDGAPQLEGIAG